MAANDSKGRHAFRFFDNREKYLLFVTTCSEKRAVDGRVGVEFDRIAPPPPALRLFDAGKGHATVSTRVPLGGLWLLDQTFVVSPALPSS